ALGLGWVIRRITNVGRNSRAAAYCAEMVNDDTPAPPRYPVRGQWQWGVMRMSEHWGFGAIRRLWRLLRTYGRRISEPVAVFAGAFDVAHATTADGGVRGVRANVRPVLPAASTLLLV